jgi:hypothetical protein
MPAPDSTQDCSVNAPSVEPNHLRNRWKPQCALVIVTSAARAALRRPHEQRELVLERHGEGIDGDYSDADAEGVGALDALDDAGCDAHLLSRRINDARIGV